MRCRQKNEEGKTESDRNALDRCLDECLLGHHPDPREAIHAVVFHSVRGRSYLTLEPLGPLIEDRLLVCRGLVEANRGSRHDLRVDNPVVDDADVLHRLMALASLCGFDPAIDLPHEVILLHREARFADKAPEVLDPAFRGVRDDELLLFQFLAQVEQELLTLRRSQVKSIVQL